MKRLAGIVTLAVIALLLMGVALAAQMTGKHAIPGKTIWPEKDEVRVTQGRGLRAINADPPGIVELWRHKAAQDPCIMPLLLTVPAARAQAC